MRGKGTKITRDRHERQKHVGENSKNQYQCIKKKINREKRKQMKNLLKKRKRERTKEYVNEKMTLKNLTENNWRYSKKKFIRKMEKIHENKKENETGKKEYKIRWGYWKGNKKT